MSSILLGRLRSSVRVLIPVLLAGLLLAGCEFSLLPEGRSSEVASSEATPTPIPTRIVPLKPTYTVMEGEIVKDLVFNGRIAPVREEGLFFRTSGRLKAVYFARNDLVRAGDVIAELEIEGLEAEREARRLDLARAQAGLDAVKKEVEFAVSMAQINLDIAELALIETIRTQPEGSVDIAIQRKNVERAQLELANISTTVDPILVNNVAQAELALERIDKRVADSQIIAPFDGMILSLSLSVGRGVEEFRPVVVLADPDDLEVSADLISNQLADLAEEMPVNVLLLGRPGDPVTGNIRKLPYPYGSGGSGATVEELDKSTRISLNVPAADVGMRLGDLVRVSAELERKENVLWLPPQAIRVFDGRRFVVKSVDGRDQRVDVKVGIQTIDRVEIVEGLELNDVVIGP